MKFSKRHWELEKELGYYRSSFNKNILYIPRKLISFTKQSKQNDWSTISDLLLDRLAMWSELSLRESLK